MNRTEILLIRNGYNGDRSGSRVPPFEFPQPRRRHPRGQRLTHEQQALRERIKELTQEANTFPLIETVI